MWQHRPEDEKAAAIVQRRLRLRGELIGELEISERERRVVRTFANGRAHDARLPVGRPQRVRRREPVEPDYPRAGPCRSEQGGPTHGAEPDDDNVERRRVQPLTRPSLDLLVTTREGTSINCS